MRRAIMPVAIAVASSAAQAQPPSAEEMWEVIQRQQEEIRALRGQLQETDTRVEATADAVESVSADRTASSSLSDKLSIGGYGEHHFNHREESNDQVDAHRFVLYVGYQFTDSVRFFSEIELEHGLSGDDKPGEVELEQAFIEWDYARNHSVQMGQFLLPVGILNETHEPDTFYGVERNNVEGRIIPTTWWETGVKFVGELAPGLSYDAAVHSGLNIEWDSADMVPESIRSGRQKSAEAVAEDWAFTTRIKYTGVPGLEVAGTYQYQQDVSQGTNMPIDDGEAELIEVHAKYQTGPLSLIALWAGWDIDSDAFDAAGSDRQDGYYLEAGYRVTDKLGLFVRKSAWDLQAGNDARTQQKQIDFGLNYWLLDQVVLKADYADDRDKVGSDSDAFNLGIGWSF